MVRMGRIRCQKSRVQAMLAASSAGSLHTESMDSIHGMERSPKVVSSAPTAAVAPPKFQIEDRALGDGGRVLPATVWSITSSLRPLRKWLFQ